MDKKGCCTWIESASCTDNCPVSGIDKSSRFSWQPILFDTNGKTCYGPKVLSNIVEYRVREPHRQPFVTQTQSRGTYIFSVLLLQFYYTMTQAKRRCLIAVPKGSLGKHAQRVRQPSHDTFKAFRFLPLLIFQIYNSFPKQK